MRERERERERERDRERERETETLVMICLEPAKLNDFYLYLVLKQIKLN